MEKLPVPKLRAGTLGALTYWLVPLKLRPPATLPGTGTGPPRWVPLLPPTISAAVGPTSSSRGYQAVIFGGGVTHGGVGVRVTVAVGVRVRVGVTVGVRVRVGVTVGVRVRVKVAVG